MMQVPIVRINMLTLLVMLFSLSTLAMESNPVAVLDSQVIAQRLLQHAIKKGFKQEVESAVRSGASLTLPDKRKRTAITNTVYYGHKNLMRFILKNFDDQLNAKYGELLIGVLRNFPRMSSDKSEVKQQKMLAALEVLARQAQDQLKTVIGEWALRGALKARNRELVELLLRNGALPGGNGRYKEVPLAKAIKRERGLVNILVMYGADVSQLKETEREKLITLLKKDTAIDHETLSKLLGMNTLLFPYMPHQERRALLSKLSSEVLVALSLISPAHHALVQAYTHGLTEFHEPASTSVVISREILACYGREISQLDIAQTLKSLFSQVTSLKPAPDFLSYTEQRIIDILEAFRNVTHLDLQGTQVAEIKAFKIIPCMLTSLKALSVSGTRFMSDHLIALKGVVLEELNASRCSKLYPAAITYIKAFKELRVLNLAHNDMDWWIALKYISELPDLRDLDLSYNKFGTPEDAEYIGKITTLERLNFACNRLTKEMIEKFKQLKNLRELNASYCSLSGEELDALSNTLQSLTHLNIAYNQRTKTSVAAIRNLGKLINLEELNIEGEALGYEGTMALLEVIKTSMPNLKRLVLAKNSMLKSRSELNTNVGPEELSSLSEISRKINLLEALKQLMALEELDVTGNGWATDETKTLKQVLPQVKIIHDRFISR